MPPCHRRKCGAARCSNSTTANAAGRLAKYTRSWRSFAATPRCQDLPTAGTICGWRDTTGACRNPSRVAAGALPVGWGQRDKILNKHAKIYPAAVTAQAGYFRTAPGLFHGDNSAALVERNSRAPDQGRGSEFPTNAASIGSLYHPKHQRRTDGGRQFQKRDGNGVSELLCWRDEDGCLST
jgi:hypothetical protein